jgi:hypothetical protein
VIRRHARSALTDDYSGNSLTSPQVSAYFGGTSAGGGRQRSEKGLGKMRARQLSIVVVLLIVVGVGEASTATARAGTARFQKVSTAVAFDKSPALRALPRTPKASTRPSPGADEIRAERGPNANGAAYRGDGALQTTQLAGTPQTATTALSPTGSFEGLNNEDNATLFGRRVNPPDPVGAVGPNHYVEMVNLVFAVYDKQGTRLAGPFLLGSLFQGFAVPDCAKNAGDPIVLYDRKADRWLLTQFTSAGPIFYNCVAVSQTPDPTGAYFRYAFSSGNFFPDYPKYGVWSNSYLLTSRDFGPMPGDYGISAYALERERMIDGDPTARMVHFFLDSHVVPIYLMGDGLLPADVDGGAQPEDVAGAPIVGTMNQGAQYNAPFDALNVFELKVSWDNPDGASFGLAAQLAVATFTSSFPCTDPINTTASQTRSCIPQPDTTHKIDVLSYRQRPTFRLAFRKFATYEALVTNQSVQATPGMAGVRWYEIRRTNGQYKLAQQGTYAPDDGINRWMGSVAMDKNGNIALGYSVSNADDVFPGIRYTGRLLGDPLGEMTLGEGVIINGSGVQNSLNARWGDYTTMSIDPTNDCTFWYVNEYIANTNLSLAPWQTRIANFRLPGCS